MKPYRCYNAACMRGREFLEFWSDDAVCPGCKTDGIEHPDVVLPLEITHFNPPHPTIKTTLFCTNKGTGFRACSPTTHVGKGHATSVPRLVNCPRCRNTEVFKKALAEADGGEVVSKNDFRFALKGGVVVSVKD